MSSTFGTRLKPFSAAFPPSGRLGRAGSRLEPENLTDGPFVCPSVHCQSSEGLASLGMLPIRGLLGVDAIRPLTYEFWYNASCDNLAPGCDHSPLPHPMTKVVWRGNGVVYRHQEGRKWMWQSDTGWSTLARPELAWLWECSYWSYS